MAMSAGPGGLLLFPGCEGRMIYRPATGSEMFCLGLTPSHPQPGPHHASSGSHTKYIAHFNFTQNITQLFENFYLV